MIQKQIKYPIECDTPTKKTAFLYRLQELLRLEHNAMGAKYKQDEINKNAWLFYLEKDFNPKSQKITTEILVQRALHKQDSTHNKETQEYFE